MTLLINRHILQIISLAVAGLLFGACDYKDQPPPSHGPGESAPNAIAVYSIGTDASYAPFESLNDKGEIVGFDIDVVQAVAKRAGINIKFVNTPWEGLFNTLGHDRDMLVSAMTISAERKQTMDFSDPYFHAQQLIVVKQASRVAKFVDLKTLKVGVQIGTVGDDAVTKLLGNSNSGVKHFESTPLALEHLESGLVDAVFSENGVIMHHMVKNPTVKFKIVRDKEFVLQHYGIALKKGDTELLGKINKGLSDIKSDGTYDAIYGKYFGRMPAETGAANDVPTKAALAPAPSASK